MNNKKMSTARRLADYHFHAEPNLKSVFLLEPVGNDDDEEPVKLLEVVEGSVATDTFAVGFAPDPNAGIPYRSMVVEVTPHQLDGLKDQGFVTIRGRRLRIGQELARPVAA